MAHTNMQASILLALILQVMVIICQTSETNVTTNASTNKQTNAQENTTNQSNASISNHVDSVTNINLTSSAANQSSPNLNETNVNNATEANITDETNAINSTVSNIIQGNDTVGDVNETNVTKIEEMVAEESSTSEEVILTGTPVMRDCINGTTDTAVCMSRMLNLTLECANETGATQDDVDIAMRMEIPSSDTGKCLTRCLLKHRGVMSPEGVFSTAGTVEYLIQVHKNESLPQEFQKLADYCFGKLKLQPISSLDTCQFAHDIALCTEEYHKTLFLRNPAMAPPVNAITTP